MKFSSLFILCIIIIALPLNSSAQTIVVPDKISIFLTDHFPEYRVLKYKYNREDNEYKVDLESGHELKLDANGEWLDIEGEYTPLPKSIIDLLPTNILRYISTNYPRKTIIRIKQKDYGYKVQLATSIDLKFKKDGSFIKKD